MQTARKESATPFVPTEGPLFLLLILTLQWTVKIKIGARTSMMLKPGIFTTGGFTFKLRAEANMKTRQ